MKKVKITFVSLAFALGCVIPATAQDSFELSVGADLVSSYQWRGQSITSASFQPGVSAGYKGFSLGAWGSTDFNKIVNEFDWTLGYGIGGFSALVTDYYGPYTEGATPKYFAKGAHILEGTLGFDFSSVAEKFPLTVAVNTCFLNNLDANGDEEYATYIELAYPLTVGEVGLNFAIGGVPTTSVLYGNEGAQITNLSIKASKDIKITDSFSLPLFGQITINPNKETAHLVVGLSF